MGEYTIDYTQRKMSLVEKRFHEHCDQWYIHWLEATGCQTVLDVGPGEGRLADLLRKQGYLVTCLEPSLDLTKHLTAKGYVVINSTIEELRASENAKKWDAVIFSFGTMNLVKNVFAQVDKIKSMAKKWIGGWISNKEQLQLYLSLPWDKYVETTRGWFPYSYISQVQWGIDVDLPIKGYAFHELSKHFLAVEPYPKMLFCLPWDESNLMRIQYAHEMDLKEKDWRHASGFLVGERIVD